MDFFDGVPDSMSLVPFCRTSCEEAEVDDGIILESSSSCSVLSCGSDYWPGHSLCLILVRG